MSERHADEQAPTWPVGSPSWVDLGVSDVGRSRAFYTAVLGWGYTGGEEEFGGYLDATVDGRAVAGMFPTSEGESGRPFVWSVYLAVADSARAQEQIAAAGGTVRMPPMQVGPFGTMGLYADPTGAAFGTWEPGDHPGFGVTDVPGAVSWTEAMVGDFERGKEFYTAVFGWTYQDMSSEDMSYATFSVPQEDAGMAGGIGQVAAGEQPCWSVVFAVDGTDAAVQRVRDAGGAVTVEPFDFEYGRLALCTGPDGEPFGVLTGRQGTPG